MRSEVFAILQDVWTEILEIWPYFLFGVALEAWIRTKKWHVKIRKTLIRYGYAAIAVATLLGVISPLCACGILPLTISLILGGLPLAPAMSLLVASPLMSPAGYLLAIKNLGLSTASVEVAGGLFMGLYAGTLTHLLETRGFDVKNLFRKALPAGDFHDRDYPEEVLRCHCSEMFSKRVEARTGNRVLVFLAKMWEGGEKVAKYVLLGLLVAAVARRYVPDWIDPLLTSTQPLALLGLALAIVPLHITQITASTILFGFNNVAVSRAAQMVLLVGGPVTALPVMGVFLTLFKPRVFLLYLGICLSGTMLVALAYQLLG
ncbi:MAG: permease [Deltaproteobacteria bacterium]|nr:permease [Deltaproteobacteria bacterium]